MKVKDKYGFLPVSIWEIKNDNILLSYTKDPFKVSEYSGSGGGKKLLSEFSPSLAKRILLYWSNERDFVFDPFAGKGTRALMSKLLKRNYVGYDVSKRFVDYANKRINENRLLNDNSINCEVKLGDSRFVDLDDETMDFIFTCPPYWDSEKYEKCEGQMSDMQWDDFIEAYFDVIKQCFRVLKYGKYCVFIVADFRRRGEFIDLHTKTIELFKKAGFKLHDIVINKLNSIAVRGIGSKAEPFRYNVKIHEYILVFEKQMKGGK